MTPKPTYEELLQEVAALRKTTGDNEYFAQIYHTIALPVMILDPNQTILSVNLATEKMLGLSAHKITGRKCYHVFHNSAGNAPPACCPFKKTAVSSYEETREMEVAALGKTFVVSCTPIHDQAGDLEKIIHLSALAKTIRHVLDAR